MKKSFAFALLAFFMLSLTSCYTYQFNVGTGAKTGVKEQGKNHYLLYGLAPLSTTDYKQLAGESTDYRVTMQHTFLDGLVGAVTLGIYTPTSVIIEK